MDSSTQNPSVSEDWFVTSLDRGLRVLSTFDRDAPMLRVGEVARRTGISRAAARRFLLTLESLGYVGCDAEQRYFLKPLALTLGYSYLASIGTAELVQPILDSTMAATGESCSLSILVNNEILYIARAISARPVQISVRPGDRLPANATSMGRVLLSGLSQEELDHYLDTTEFKAFTDHTITDPDRLRECIAAVRTQGYAIVDSEVGNGIVSIAVPVRGPRDEIRAAININTQTGRKYETDSIRRHLPTLQVAADQVGKVLASLPAAFFRS
ncbi:IclR family transcriptional regulator domain-containing protein [Oricola indica]|uniref:IclR family transcriptional regulator domain-containing protein n=1 Tax=Oricola indica TaxID=2872591 RepID=UPI003CCBC540